jgi:SAM-dependent methyltransferase
MPRAPRRTQRLSSVPGEQKAVEAMQAPTQPARGAPDPDYIVRNRAAWDSWAPGYLGPGRKAWNQVDLRWGIWGIPESQLQLFADIGTGGDVIELGCGTAEISAWLARNGARPVAVDLSSRQVHNVELLQRDFQLNFPVVCANAEAVHYADASFDVAVSDYGTSLWCDPQRWLPEANRLLRPGGVLIFLTNSELLLLCTPEGGGAASDRLLRDFFSDSRVEFEEGGAVEFHSTHGTWIRLLRSCGFVVENLIEARPPPDARARYDFVTLEWALHWPSEEIWIARKA